MNQRSLLFACIVWIVSIVIGLNTQLFSQIYDTFSNNPSPGPKMSKSLNGIIHPLLFLDLNIAPVLTSPQSSNSPSHSTQPSL